MKTFLLIYCALTIMFVGGCALVLGAAAWESQQGFFRESVVYVLLLAVAANIAFMALVMKAKDWGGTPLIWAGVAYTVVQAVLFMSTWTSHDARGAIFIALLLFALKGLALVMTGQSQNAAGSSGR